MDTYEQVKLKNNDLSDLCVLFTKPQTHELIHNACSGGLFSMGTTTKV